MTACPHTSGEGAALVVDLAEFGGVIPCFQLLDGTCGVVETKHYGQRPSEYVCNSSAVPRKLLDFKSDTMRATTKWSSSC